MARTEFAIDLGDAAKRDLIAHVVGAINLPVGRLLVEEVIVECSAGPRPRAEERTTCLRAAGVAVKVIDIFGNDTMTLLSVHVG